jgi:hypothetical protein
LQVEVSLIQPAAREFASSGSKPYYEWKSMFCRNVLKEPARRFPVAMDGLNLLQSLL